jgi:hypothetical protein
MNKLKETLYLIRNTSIFVSGYIGVIYLCHKGIEKIPDNKYRVFK